MKHLTFVVSVFSLVGCSEFNISAKPDADGVPGPEIQVTPLELRFGERVSGETEVESFTVTNVGEGPLTVSEVVIGAGESFTVLSEVHDAILDPAEEIVVDVSFSPLGAGGLNGHALVLSDDFETPEVRVDLVGRGAVPELLIDPASHDFGIGYIPCDDTVEISLTNIGVELLEIYGLSFEGEQMRLVEDLAYPVLLGPDESKTVGVIYTPDEVGAAWGDLTVDSNDPRGLVAGDQRADTSFGSRVVDGFEVPLNPPVDILFAVDQSCSMEDDQRRLSLAFRDFITEIDNVTGGWQVGVVTLDSGCFNGGIMNASTPDYIGKFSDAVSVMGPFNTWLTESLLQLSAKSADKSDAGECNAGFLRDDSLLHVIVVSDEREQSGDPEGYTRDMEAMKAGSGGLMVSAVVDIHTACGSEGIDNGPGGYDGAVAATGGLMLDICDDAWGERVDELAAATITGLRDYPLTARPDTGSFEIYVDGELWTDGYTYDPSTNTISLDAELEGGEFIEILYDSYAACD